MEENVMDIPGGNAFDLGLVDESLLKGSAPCNLQNTSLNHFNNYLKATKQLGIHMFRRYT
jgi:hypothetical protein